MLSSVGFWRIFISLGRLVVIAGLTVTAAPIAVSSALYDLESEIGVEQATISAVSSPTRTKIRPRAFLRFETREETTNFHAAANGFAVDDRAQCLDDNQSDPRASMRCSHTMVQEAAVSIRSDGLQLRMGKMPVYPFYIRTEVRRLPFAWERFFSPRPPQAPAVDVAYAASEHVVGLTLLDDATTASLGEFNGANSQPMPVLRWQLGEIASFFRQRAAYSAYDSNHSRIFAATTELGHDDSAYGTLHLLVDMKRRRRGDQVFTQRIDTAEISSSLPLGRVRVATAIAVTESHVPEVCTDSAGIAACTSGSTRRQLEWEARLRWPVGAVPGEIQSSVGSFWGMDSLDPDQAICSGGRCGREARFQMVWALHI